MVFYKIKQFNKLKMYCVYARRKEYLENVISFINLFFHFLPQLLGKKKIKQKKQKTLLFFKDFP